MDSSVLNSWKEIAEYVGRGVRTVQRWEAEMGLPVHRPRHHLRSPVVAIPEEIDEWLRGGRHSVTTASNTIIADARVLRARMSALMSRSVAIRHELREELTHTTQLITRLEQRAASLTEQDVRGTDNPTCLHEQEATLERHPPKTATNSLKSRSKGASA